MIAEKNVIAKATVALQTSTVHATRNLRQYFHAFFYLFVGGGGVI